ncbi:hypothetical protein FRB99_006191 [Tulasnella sp. 403]|nr:hypothetical protein FRB99_006191 [Tulasnella sp. 403]
MFGYEPTIYMPKPGSKDIYQRLQRQCTNCKIPTISSLDDLKAQLEPGKTHCILDAIFGFSFHPPVRPPFDQVLPLLNQSNLPIVSVDIPSGWDVEKGPVRLTTNEGDTVGDGLNASVLLSLTAPKEGVKAFKGRHFLGGRFVPKELEEKYQLNLPAYPGIAQIVELPLAESSTQTTASF